MKVTEYEGHKVPEGATHYASESRFQRAGFYKHNKIRPFFYSVNLFKEWVESISKEIPSFAIEIPDQQEDNAEWVPAVGCGAEVWHGNEWVGCVYFGTGLYDDNIYQILEGEFKGELNGDKNIKHFRPLKNDEQKAEEAFYLKAFKVYKSCMSCNEFATALFKAGFTAPEGEL